MKLPPPPTPTSEEVSAILAQAQQTHKMYEHLPFTSDPKKALISTSLKHLKLLPYGELLSEILPDLLYGSEHVRTAAITKYEQHEDQILKALETETHVALMESFEHRYQGMVLEHCADLIKEYDCTTPSEKALCEIAAGAFVRHLSNLRQLKDLFDDTWSFSNRRTKRKGSGYSHEIEETWTLTSDRLRHANLISKEIERSARRYQSVIAQITQKKSPVPEIRIQTAFMAQNQQINAGQPPARNI